MVCGTGWLTLLTFSEDRGDLDQLPAKAAAHNSALIAGDLLKRWSERGGVRVKG